MPGEKPSADTRQKKEKINRLKNTDFRTRTAIITAAVLFFLTFFIQFAAENIIPPAENEITEWKFVRAGTSEKIRGELLSYSQATSQNRVSARLGDPYMRMQYTFPEIKEDTRIIIKTAYNPLSVRLDGEELLDNGYGESAFSGNAYNSAVIKVGGEQTLDIYLYAPLAFSFTVKNPVEPDEYEERQIARVTQDGFEIKQDDSWQPFEIKGFNINGEAPGGKRYEYSRDYSFYSELLQTAANAGANCIRTYDLLPPEFYRALCEYNGNADSVLYLIQGIMTPPDTDPAKSFEKIDSIKQNVASAIAAVHGEGSLPDDDAVYSYNASPYVISYIIDPRLDGESSDAILAGENAGADYSGKYISASGNGAEALAAELCDYALQCMQSDYGCMRPVSAVSSAERLEGAEWLTEGMRGFNFSNMQLSDGAEGLYYTSVSLNPDDRQLIDNEAAFAEMYSDSSGKFAWGGYIGQVRKLYNGPVLIDKAGLSTSTDVFEQESSVNGLSETEQGEGIVRMLKAADEQGYAGMLIADLNDNWSAVSEQSEQYTIPASDSGLWQDTTVRAETTGIVAVDSVQPQESAIQLNDNGEKSIMSQMQLSYNETYVYITLLLKNDIDYDKNEMIIGIDTYQRNDGEYYYDIKVLALF